MNRNEQLRETVPDEEFLTADGFDEADILIKQDMTEEEAIEYFYFNTEGAYVGEKTPIWCEDGFFIDDENEQV